MSDTVKVVLNRSSVAMGDDVFSHRVFWAFPATATIDDLLVEISTNYLPRVAGQVGWRICVNTADELRPQEVAIIYTRDNLRQEPHICRMVTGATTLVDLTRRARLSDLDVYAVYLTWDMGRPITLSEVTSGPTFTTARAAELHSEAAAEAETDWVLTKELDRRALADARLRRDWIATNILSSDIPPPGYESFIAHNFHLLIDLHCPASVSLAAQLLGGVEPANDDIETVVDINARPAVVTLAMVIAAFEWNSTRYSWRADRKRYCKPYFEFLASRGYQLTPIEQVMAGYINVEDLKLSPEDAARLGRIRQLRELQYQLRVDRYDRKILTDEQYQVAVGPVHAELSALGELAGPT